MSTSSPSFTAGAYVFQSQPNPAETRYDQLMTAQLKRLTAAFAEKDDQKAIALITEATDAMRREMHSFFPGIARWYKGLPEAERKAFKERLMQKPYMTDMRKLLRDPALQKRLFNNPALQKHLEQQSARLWEYDLFSLDKPKAAGK